MLEAIRKRSASFLIKILFGLLILSFAAWGIGDIFRGRAGTTNAATVGDVDIPPERLNNEYQRELRNLRIRLGTALTAEQARALGVVHMVLGRLVEQTLFDIGASEMGITISDELVRQEIQSNPAFQGISKTFDRNLFQQVIQNNGYSEDQFAELVRDDLVRGQLAESVATGATAPKALVEALYRHRQQKRVAEVVVVTDKQMPEAAEPDEATLAKFHEESAQLFTAPEYRTLTTILLEVTELAKEIAVAEEKVREAFEQRQDQFNQPERRGLQQMVIATEDDAKRAKRMLDEGTAFALVAKEVAGQEAAALDLGVLGRDELLSELADAAFSLGEGAYSDPVRSPLGWHIMRVTAIEAARRQTIDEVGDALKAEIARDLAIDSMFNLANQVEDALGGGATLEEAASSFNLRLVKFDAVDRSGRGRDGKPVEGLPGGRQFLTTAFETEENTESTLTEAGSDAYFVVRVDRVIAPALRPLAEVRADVLAAWRHEQRKQVAETLAKTLLEQVKGGADPSTLAAGNSLSFKTTKPFVRSPGGNSDDLPQELVDALFDVAPGEAVAARGEDSSYVARLKEIQATDPGADRKGIEALRQEMRQSIRGDLLAQFAGALRQRHPVSVNDRVMEELF